MTMTPPGTPGGPQWPGAPGAPVGPASAPPPGYGYAVPQEHPQGTTILVLGILSLVVCGLLGPVAWTMGSKALTEIDRNPAAYTNRGSVSAGRILGIISSVLLIVGIVVTVIAFLVLAVAGTSSSTSGNG